MKQKLLMMLAALMLMGTSAMAQSETLKGDVNGDGMVDVADIAAVIAIMAKNAEGETTKYYWYINNDPEILFGDPVGEVVDYSKASQVSSFADLQYASDGTQITMKNTGRNSVFILCPAEWVNNWSIYNQVNDIDLTTGFTDISEFITNLNNNGVEYKFFEASGVIGNTLYVRGNK